MRFKLSDQESQHARRYPVISFADVQAAYELIRPIAIKTPMLSSAKFSEFTKNDVYFKAENFQRTGSFKIRGAYNKMASLSDINRSRGVIAHSSGNHAQGVALASKLFGVRATIVMPYDSVFAKVISTKALGAEVVYCGTSTYDRELTTDKYIDEFHYELIHPYDDEKVMAGQGTVAIEIFQEIKELDLLFIPVGGGGLISGCAIVARHLCPNITIVGVETEGAADCKQSFNAGHIVSINEAHTIADGIRTLSVGKLNFDIIRNYVDDVVTVTDDEVLEMMRFCLDSMKILVEPTGAVAPAAIRGYTKGIKQKRICAIITGGNVDLMMLRDNL